MIPSVIATQVRQGIEDFLRTTYPPAEPFFDDILEHFFQEQGALFKGPYISLKLPFRPGVRGAGVFPGLPMRFPPYRHQELAFERLTGPSPQSTLIATGTGSGKTECFLYPLLDYCLRHRGETGVKAIIIYPMNALATDQARRFAREIYNNRDLNGNVTAGLFIGGQDSDDGSKIMTEDSVITCKETLRRYPPDILMTNYKMLDYLLLRPQDFKLWEGNSPETLKYVVVDELHTFDGAQGTDLACLLRRLLARLKAPPEQVCFVGTSATLGGGDSGEELSRFASELFGAKLPAAAIIREDVLKPGEFLGDNTLIRYFRIPDPGDLDRMRAADYKAETDYVRAQCALWFDNWQFDGNPDEAFQVSLGEKLREHFFFQNFIRMLKGQTVDEQALMTELDKILPDFSRQTGEFRTALVDSMLALISCARREIMSSDGRRAVVPFLHVRLQLWQRELRRMVATVEASPRLRYAADLLADEPVQSLPLLHCRACGRMGWLSAMGQTDNKLSDDLGKIYSAFFSNSPTIQYVFHEDRVNSPAEQLEFKQTLCGHCLNFTGGDNPAKCANCGTNDKLITVICKNPRITNHKGRVHVYKNCPFCGGADTLTIVGSRSASLISVAISQLFASPFNDDRKLLAFSDSVQDASHRAGFFGARTYRFNLRAAIQQVLVNTDKTLTIAELPAAFTRYWLEKLGSQEAFAAQFIAPDMQWLPGYETLVKTGKMPEDDDLLDLIKKRIHWDVLNEYGHSARIGRTLEKTGCSIPRVNPAALEQWTAAVHRRLTGEFGQLRELAAPQVKRLLTGIVRNCRVRGGLHADFLKPYIQSGGNAFKLNPRLMPFMPAYAGSRRAPAFIMSGGVSGRFDPLTGAGSSLTTYQKWLNRCLDDVTAYSRDIFQIILDAAEAAGIFIAEECGTGKVYGLNPALLELESMVDQYICSRTRHGVSAPHSEQAVWAGMPSERFDAPDGVLVPQAARKDYYGDLYRNGRVHRAVPREHTGLLEREEREALEQSFINGKSAFDPNILSCTPTLEMGINIGDLSTVILCSVPPSRTNYVQRIGRAGRRDGNAFNFVVATGKPHDLHFFDEPLEMIDGEIPPAGIFLNAPAVLERQLTAFCFDRWMESVHGSREVIPAKLNHVLNGISDQSKNPKNFPFNLLNYIELHRTELLDGFTAIFKGVFTPASIEHLRQFMCGGTSDEGCLDYRIINRLETLRKERDSLRGKIRVLKDRIDKMDASPAKDAQTGRELVDLKYEKSALNRIVGEINDKQTFNFFTDEGLLPNYAFPESGVSLRSVIYRRKFHEDGKGGFETWTHEYERPARAAIQELAPGNAFYVDGRKLLITQIDLNVSVIDRWRFCGACNHAENEATVTQVAACPKCGSTSWADANMIRNLVHMKQVVANQSDQDSRSFDDSEEREPAFFNKYMLTEIPREYVEKAYRLKDENLPFGFEFVRKATFREVNFGKQDMFDGDEIEIAGKKVPRQGFRICRECGKVDPGNGDPFVHAIGCKHYGKDTEKGMIECLYLYREFESEAIRILLPVADMDMESRRPSFIAALYMGLSKKFKGNVDHLQVMEMDEPVQDSPFRKKYLVLYDQVPGGTGYLKELTRTPADIMDMLAVAYDTLKTCPCQSDETKDGCYKCLYAYRVSRDLPDIKRSTAMEFLEQIIRQRDNLEEIKSIETISVNALFDSELEARFIEALRRSRTPDNNLELRKQVVHGKPGYFLKINSISYLIEPQVSVGEEQDVAVPSKVDFMIYPVRQPREQLPPVAVFTDGFAFHADPSGDNYRLPKDLEQRMALVKSGKYLCWSITYDDVMSKFDDTVKDYWEQLHPQGIDKFMAAYPQIRPLRGVIAKNALDGLVQFLSVPNLPDWKQLAFIYAISATVFGMTETAIAEAAETVILDPGADLHHFAKRMVKSSSQERFWSHYDNPSVTMFAHGDGAKIRAGATDSIKIFLRLEDRGHDINVAVFKRAWNGLLQAYNLLQFIRETTVISSRFLFEGYCVPELKAAQAGRVEELHPAVDAESIRQLRSLVLPEALPVLDMVIKAGFMLPDVGYELTDDRGMVVADAELAWPDRQIAFLLSESPFEQKFSAAGWHVVIISESGCMDSLTRLLAK